MLNYKQILKDHIEVVGSLEALEPQFRRIADAMAKAVDAGATIFWMGNGGSAADAQHMAAELVGRYQQERRAIASVALTTDSSVLTAVANDYDYSVVFSRQLEALCKQGDVVIGMTTSGQSANVLKGLAVAKACGAYTIGMTGQKGTNLPAHCDECFIIPSTNTARVQEAHMLIGHSLCEYLENHVAENQP